MTIRSQDEIVADLIQRADTLEHSARHAPHSKSARIALRLAAHVLRVAALDNSRVDSFSTVREEFLPQLAGRSTVRAYRAMMGSYRKPDLTVHDGGKK